MAWEAVCKQASSSACLSHPLPPHQAPAVTGASFCASDAPSSYHLWTLPEFCLLSIWISAQIPLSKQALPWLQWGGVLLHTIPENVIFFRVLLTLRNDLVAWSFSVSPPLSYTSLSSLAILYPQHVNGHHTFFCTFYLDIIQSRKLFFKNCAEKRKIIEGSEAKGWFFEKIDIVNKPLARFVS